MKILNFTNLLYCLILLAFLGATLIKVLRYKGWDRYYYGASVTAPALYPVYIREAYFLLPDGDINLVATSNANDRQGFSQWGTPGHNSAATRERLPANLVIKYVAYQDSAFYTDTIALPQKIMRKAFHEISQNGIDGSRYGGSATKRLDFLIGLANQGNLVVWLWGAQKEYLILKHRISPHEPVGDDTYYDGRLTKKNYLEKVFDLDSVARAAILRQKDKQVNYIDTPSRFNTFKSQ